MTDATHFGPIDSKLESVAYNLERTEKVGSLAHGLEGIDHRPSNAKRLLRVELGAGAARRRLRATGYGTGRSTRRFVSFKETEDPFPGAATLAFRFRWHSWRAMSLGGSKLVLSMVRCIIAFEFSLDRLEFSSGCPSEQRQGTSVLTTSRHHMLRVVGA
jgi:hypothetical protein